MTPAGRDVLVVLREELAAAREALRDAASVGPKEPRAAELARGAEKLRLAADALETRIRAAYDMKMLESAAASFRAAASAFGRLAAQRRDERRRAPEVQRVLRRVVVHAREIARITQESGSDHVGAAIASLAQLDAWTGPLLDSLVSLVDTLLYLARKRLGDGAKSEQVSSLVDRASSTAVVSSLHALKDLAGRARSEPTVMRDRFQLDGALKSPSAAVVDRLAAWFKLDEDARARLHSAVETFTRRLLDRAQKRGTGYT